MSQVLVRAVRGCCAAVLFLAAVAAVLLTFLGTFEMETFPGLRENRAPLVVYVLGFAVLLSVGALALAGWRSSGGRAGVICVVALLAVRMWSLAPMLHCWSYDSVGRQGDGSYTCYDRG